MTDIEWERKLAVKEYKAKLIDDIAEQVLGAIFWVSVMLLGGIK